MGLDGAVPGDQINPAGNTYEIRRGTVLTQAARPESQTESENRD